MSLAGNHREAYELALANERDCSPMYRFNRACFASLCGEFSDAIDSLGICFLQESILMTDCFLDPDLDPVWRYLESLEPNLLQASFLLYPQWGHAIQRWESRQDSIFAPLPCLEQVPHELRKHLQPNFFKGKTVVASGAPPSAWKDFEDWKWSTSARNVEALRQVRQKSSQVLISHQPQFAVEQNQIGNFTATRLHFFLALAYFPDYQFSPKATQKGCLQVLLADIDSAMKEDAGFCRKIENTRFATSAGNIEEAQDHLDSISPEGKKTNVFALRNFQFELKRGRTDVALELGYELLKKWPFDFSLVKDLATEAMKNEDWLEAERLLANPYPSFENFHTFHSLEMSLKNRQFQPAQGFFFEFIGHRGLGGHLKRTGVSPEDCVSRNKLFARREERTTCHKSSCVDGLAGESSLTEFFTTVNLQNSNFGSG